jgi:hypothetical protein
MRSRSRPCVGCSWRWGWPVGSPEWVEDMRAARVPWVAGMRSASVPVYGCRLIVETSAGRIVRWADEIGDYSEGDGWSADEIAEEWADAVPDLEHRATFLLCLDEAERRGIRELFDEDGAYFASIDAGDARALYMWADDLARPLLLAALARALRETAPGGGR